MFGKKNLNLNYVQVLNTTLGLSQHLVQGYMYIKALLIYLFDELSPSKNRFDHTTYHYLSIKACHQDMSSNKQMFFMSEVKLDLATEICMTTG